MTYLRNVICLKTVKCHENIENYRTGNPQIQIHLALVTQILIDLLSLNIYYQFNFINFVVVFTVS